MQKSKIITVTLLLIAFFGFYIFKYHMISVQKIDSNQTVVKPSQNPKANIALNKTTKKHTRQEPVKELNERQVVTSFDDDPIVDREIIAQKYKPCSTLLDRLKTNISKDYSYSKLQKERPDYYKKQLDFCQKINAEHPEYNLENKNSNKNSPNSYLGRIYSDEEFAFSEIENNSESIQRAIINADPNLMLSFYADWAYFTFVPDLRLILESQQNDYGLIIGKYSQMLFACRLGADCGENSAIVFTTCLYNEDLCANNIEELIKTKFSKGQQADIELGYQHLVDSYGIVE